MDAIFEPAAVIRKIAARIGQETGLPRDWLNDAAKGFIVEGFSRQEVLVLPHLRVWAPEPQYMLAMKCISARWDTSDSCPDCGCRWPKFSTFAILHYQNRNNALHWCFPKASGSSAGKRVMVADTLTGTVLQGTYRIERLIGQGGMGTVYQASHLRLPRRFAVKVLTPELTQRPDALTRFRREAQITSGIGHPHILEVIDFNSAEDGTPYILMEYLEGEALSARLKREGALGLSRTVSIFRQIASALQAAHSRGVVHRDLKPDNIFLCRHGDRDDYVKVLDFGISKVLGGQTALTRTNALMGTPYYMSPEQAGQNNAEVDQRSDVHAMGAILFEMLVGRPPFTAGTLPRLLYDIVNSEAPRLRSIRKDAPRALEPVVARALAKNQAERFDSMLDFWQTLAAALELRAGAEQEFTEDRGGDWAEVSRSLNETEEDTVPKAQWAPGPAMPESRIQNQDSQSIPPGSGADPHIGQHLGNYVVSSLIGKGGMGAVYLAEHPKIGRQVAVKFLAPHLCLQPGIAERFTAEAKAITRIDHPNVVDIYDFGQEQSGQLYYVMELLKGRELAAIIEERGAMAPAEAASYLEQICHGLQAAHDQGVVHRDLKPENIYVVDRRPMTVKILDFGIAKLLETDGHQASHLTSTGVVMGSPLFIAPEQAAGKVERICPQTDIYSLGAILYTMLAGHPPFTGDVVAVILAKHIEQKPPPLHEVAPSVPPAVSALVHRCLEKDPARRPRQAIDLADALAGVLRDPDLTGPLLRLPRAGHARPSPAHKPPAQSVTTMRAAAGEVTATSVSRSPAVKWLGVGAAGLVAAVGAVLLFGGGKPSPAPDPPPAKVAAVKSRPAAPAPPPAKRPFHVLTVTADRPKVICRFKTSSNSEPEEQPAPCRIRVPEGTEVQLEIARKGYRSLIKTLAIVHGQALAVRVERRGRKIVLDDGDRDTTPNEMGKPEPVAGRKPEPVKKSLADIAPTPKPQPATRRPKTAERAEPAPRPKAAPERRSPSNRPERILGESTAEPDDF